MRPAQGCENMSWLNPSMVVAIVSLGVSMGANGFLYLQVKETKKNNDITKQRYKELEKEYLTYNALDEKYIEFQKLCLDHPYLDVFDIKDANPKQLNPQQQKEELIAFTMLFSIFERAFIMYEKQDPEIREEQWRGWDEYIHAYCKRKNFVAAWKISGSTFDERFAKYMEKIMKECGSDRLLDSKS